MGLNRGLASNERGFMMAALLVTLSVMAVLIGTLVPVWNTAARREREEELVFRGEQYARAMMLFQRKYANARPPSVDVLLNERFLRKKYKDPITNEDFELLAAGAGPAQPGLGGLGQAGQGQRGQGTGARGGATPGQPQTGLGGAQPGVGQAPGVGAGLQAAQAAGAQGGPGLVGVVSKSKEQSFRLYKGQQRYSDWVFMPVQMSTQAGTGAAGAGAPGLRGAGAGAPGTRGNPQRGQPNGGPGGLGGSGRQQGPRSGQPFGGSPGMPQPQGGQRGPGPFGQ